MKDLTPSLATHYGSRAHSLCTCLDLTRTDGQVFRFTSLDRDLTIGADVYSSRAGLSVSDLSMSSGLSTDNLELQVTYEDAVFTRADLLGGKWSGATFRVFRVNWQAPGGGQDLLLTGRTGEVRVTVKQGYSIELRSLSQIMQQPVAALSSPLCRYTLGVNDGVSRCPVDLGPLTHALTVVSVGTDGGIAVSGAARPAEYYVMGSATSTSGPNAGISRLVRASDANTVYPLRPFPYPVSPGDAVTLKAGCQKRFTEDCKTRFGAALDFGGEPHLPGLQTLMRVDPA